MDGQSEDGADITASVERSRFHESASATISEVNYATAYEMRTISPLESTSQDEYSTDAPVLLSPRAATAMAPTTTATTLNTAAERLDSGEMMSSSSSPTFYMDWTRTCGVWLVMCVHSWRESYFLIKHEDKEFDEFWAAKFKIWEHFLLTFGMPAFFLVSAQAAARGRSYHLYWRWVWKKTLRLLLPTVIGLFVLVIPTAFIGRHWRFCVSYEMRHTNSIFEFYVLFWEKFTCSGVEWLWFLVILFLLAVFNTHFMQFVYYDAVKPQKSAIALVKFVPQLLVAVVGIHFIVDWTWVVTWSAAYVGIVVVRSVFRGMLKDVDLLCCVVPIVGTYALGFIEDQISEPEPSDTPLASICYFSHFYVCGFIFERAFMQREARGEAAVPGLTSWKGFIYVFFFMVMYLLPGVSFPATSEDLGSVLRWPMYVKRTNRLLYITLGWIWTFLGIVYQKSLMNSQYYVPVHNFLCGGSMTAYMVHPLWIQVWLSVAAHPYSWNGLNTLWTTAIFTFVASYMTHSLLLLIGAGVSRLRASRVGRDRDTTNSSRSRGGLRSRDSYSRLGESPMDDSIESVSIVSEESEDLEMDATSSSEMVVQKQSSESSGVAARRTTTNGSIETV